MADQLQACPDTEEHRVRMDACNRLLLHSIIGAGLREEILAHLATNSHVVYSTDLLVRAANLVNPLNRICDVDGCPNCAKITLPNGDYCDDHIPDK